MGGVNFKKIIKTIIFPVFMPISAPAASLGLQKKRKQLPSCTFSPPLYLRPPDRCSHRLPLAARDEKIRSDLVATKCFHCFYSSIMTSAGTLLPHTTQRSGREAYPRLPLPERRQKNILPMCAISCRGAWRPVGSTPYGSRYSRNNRPARGSRHPDCSPNSRRPYRSNSSCGRAPGARRTPRPPLHRRLQ